MSAALDRSREEMSVALDRSREETAQCDHERETLSARNAQLQREFMDVVLRECARGSLAQTSTAPSSDAGKEVEVKREKDCDAYWQHVRPTPLQATGTMTHTRPTLVHTKGGREGGATPSEGGGGGGGRDESPAPSARGGGSGSRPGRQGGGRPPAQPNGGGPGPRP